jgi:hypothetical protein
VGNQIIVADSFGTWGTNNLTIDPTALIKIAGQTAGTTLTCNINSVAVTLVYTGATYGWDIFAQIGANDTSVLTQTNTVTGITNKTFVAPVLGAALASTLQATTTMGVGAATPAASGAGITFPATQSASTDANTLDDYREGSFTGTLAGVSGTVTGTVEYVKCGNAVTLHIPYFTGTGNTTTLAITGMPVILRPLTALRAVFVRINSTVLISLIQTSGSINLYSTLADDPWPPTGTRTIGVISVSYIL